MPRKRQFRRLRRLRLVGTVGGLAVVLGIAAVVSATGDAVHHRAGGMAGVVIGAALVLGGIGPAVWAVRHHDRLAVREREELRSCGLDDGLPMGAFREQQDIGLEAADVLLVVAAVFAGFTVVLATAGLSTSGVDPVALGLIGLVGVLPGLVCLRVGTGTRLWLTPERIERRRWPARSMRWADVERIVPMSRGGPDRRPSDATQLLVLQAGPPRRGWRGGRPGRSFTIRVMALEVSTMELLPLVRARVPAPVGPVASGGDPLP